MPTTSMIIRITGTTIMTMIMDTDMGMMTATITRTIDTVTRCGLFADTHRIIEGQRHRH